MRRVTAALSGAFGLAAFALLWETTWGLSGKDLPGFLFASVTLSLASAALPWLASAALWGAARLLGLGRGQAPPFSAGELKRALIAALALGAACVGEQYLEDRLPGRCHGPAQPLSLDFKLPPRTYHVGESLWLDLGLKNEGCEPYEVYDHFMIADLPKGTTGDVTSELWVDVRDSSGNMLEADPFWAGFHGEFDPYQADPAANRRFRAQFFEAWRESQAGRYEVKLLGHRLAHFTLRPGEAVQAAPTVRKGLKAPSRALEQAHDAMVKTPRAKAAQDEPAMLGRHRLLKEIVFPRPGTYTVQAVYRRELPPAFELKSKAFRVEVLP